MRRLLRFPALLRPALTLAVWLPVSQTPASGQEVPDTAQVTITGTVLDFATLDPISGVEIHLSGSEQTDVTDSSGGFSFQDVPLGVHEMVMTKDGYISLQGPLTVVKSGSFVVHLRPKNSPEPGLLTGNVIDPLSGDPIETAMLTLQGTGLRRMTNADGRFAFGEIPPGLHLLEVEHIGYASRSDSVRVVSGRLTEAEIPLSIRPIEMEPITVTARSRWLERNGFYERMGGEYAGRQWTADEIQQSGVVYLDMLLGEVEGIRARWRGIRGLSIQSRLGKSYMRGGWCEMPLYIDGIRVQEIDLDMVIPERVGGLEVYHGTKAPIRYSIDNPCGVILVWTNR